MEPEDSLPHSQMPASCRHSEPDWFSDLHVTFLQLILKQCIFWKCRVNWDVSFDGEVSSYAQGSTKQQDVPHRIHKA